MEFTIKTSWDELTWREYEQVEQILSADIPASYKTINLVALLAGQNVDTIEKLTVPAFQRLLPALEFLNTKPETHYHKFEYTVNGREYDFKGKIDEITTAQYIDYRTYMDEEIKDVVKLMSVFIIPKGHEYNDGYDLELVKSDIADMCWLDVKALAFFFNMWLATYTLTLKCSLTQDMKKRVKKLKTKEEVKKLKAQIKEVEESFNSSAYYLLYSESATKQKLH